jgi:hypothetical protein
MAVGRVIRRVLARIRYNRKFALHRGILYVTEEGLRLDRYRLRNESIELALEWEFRWNELQRIIAFKRDLLTTDLICIAFELTDRAVEVDEKMEGYNSTLEGMTAHFPRLNHQWLSSVAFPPFATNLTTIWQGPTA